MTRRIPTTLLSGYLGAGKTTAINRLLANSSGRRIAVLVNDFGAVNIDANLIESRTDQTISLTNGCVCCSIADDLGDALDAQTRRNHPPEHIVIEASGVAESGRISKHIAGWPKIALKAIVCIADAETVKCRAHDKFVGTLVRRQLGAADLLILNKLDLIAVDAIADLRAFLDDQAPRSHIIETTNGAVDPDLLIGTGVPSRHLQLENASETKDHSHHLASTVWVSERSVEVELLKQVLNDLPQTLHRLKGFVLDSYTGKKLLVQLVGRQISVSDAEANGSLATSAPVNELALIGSCSLEELQAVCTRIDACVV